MIGSNTQKVSKPLTRPTSGQQKRPPSGTNPSKMEVLAPEKSTTATIDYSKPQLLPKKEMRLERTGTASSKKSNHSITSASEISAYDSSKDNLFASNGFSSAKKSTIEDKQVQEELKKVSSKPFSTKPKAKKSTTALEESMELNQSSRSTNFEASQRLLSTPNGGMDVSTEFRSQALFTNRNDSEDQSITKLGRDSTRRTLEDFNLLDHEDFMEEEKVDENVEIDINFGDLQKRLDEIQAMQKQRESIAREYVSHIANIKDEEGESLVEFPENFAEIVRSTVDGARNLEELKEKGMASDAEIERFIRQQITTSLKTQEEKKVDTQQKKKEEEEDPYKKEKEKIKELDRILAAKEREYRERKNAEKMRRLQDLEDLGEEEEISVENIDRIFLTEHNKRKSRLSATASSTRVAPAEKNDDKLNATKPKLKSNATGHIKKNIENAFNKNRDLNTFTKLTPEDQKRLEELMSVIDATLDGTGSEDQLMREAVPNPYDSSYGVGERMAEIDRRIAAYGVAECIEGLGDMIDYSKLPKEKSLREQAERRALQDRNENINRRLMEINNRERLNEVVDEQTVLALVEQLRRENGPLPNENQPRRDPDAEAIEKALQETEGVLATFNEEELLGDISSLSKKAASVKQKLKLMRENIEARNDIAEAEAKLAQQRKNMIDSLANRKETLKKLDQTTVQGDLDDLSRLERSISQMEQNAFDSEERFRKGLYESMMLQPQEEQPEMTLEEYDRQIMEQLRITNPELFVETSPEVKFELIQDEEGIDYSGYNPVKEVPEEEQSVGQ